jgi:flavin reductase (DIM6/NTAB) family NADH-FMN oxidoreductase RutF
MTKRKMGAQTWLYPEPVVLIGADVDDKPNFMTVAWIGIGGAEPPIVSVAIRHTRYSLKGIRQYMAFSVNIPSMDMIEETDYCGIVSGAKTDKVEDCQFKVFYGKTAGAPFIEQCPINLECEVLHILDVGSHSLVIGKIVETHVSEDCLTGGKPDINKIKPVVYIPRPTPEYRGVGEFVADTYSIGKEIKKIKDD